jgi:hypothetical protein
VHWSEFDRGGHFAAMETPDLLVDDVRASSGPSAEHHRSTEQCQGDAAEKREWRGARKTSSNDRCSCVAPPVPPAALEQVVGLALADQHRLTRAAGGCTNVGGANGDLSRLGGCGDSIEEWTEFADERIKRA